jgi:hypothetical protein
MFIQVQGTMTMEKTSIEVTDINEWLASMFADDGGRAESTVTPKEFPCNMRWQNRLKSPARARA